MRRVAQAARQPHLAEGILLGPLNATARVLPRREAAGLLSVVSGAQWPQTRLAAAGLAESSLCQRCLSAPGTLRHRHVLCITTEVQR